MAEFEEWTKSQQPVPGTRESTYLDSHDRRHRAHNLDPAANHGIANAILFYYDLRRVHFLAHLIHGWHSEVKKCEKSRTQEMQPENITNSGKKIGLPTSCWSNFHATSLNLTQSAAVCALTHTQLNARPVYRLDENSQRIWFAWHLWFDLFGVKSSGKKFEVNWYHPWLPLILTSKQ